MDGLILILLLFGVGIWASRQGSRKRLQAWEDAAKSCGLKFVEVLGSWHPRLEARAGPVRVRIEFFGDSGKSVRAVVIPPGPRGFQRVRIRPESLFQLAPEIEIGDGSFDKAFLIEGPVKTVLALLDAETRLLLSRLSAEARLEINDGEIRAEHNDPEKILSLLPSLLEIGQRFAQPMNIPLRLAENACQDPEAGVRLQNLLLLIHELPGDPRTVDALRAACSDPSPEIRLRAARELRAEGHGVLLQLAEGLEDDAVSGQAVAILDRSHSLPFESTHGILFNALRRRRLQTARACLEALGHGKAPEAFDVLAKVMEREQGELAAAAAQALRTIGNPAAEGPLILALQREQADLRVAAANALGRVGSAEAVLPLKEAAEHFSLDLDLRRATRQAIAEIQSRLQGASPGQLSLSGAEAGRLSLTQAEAGQLSIATDQNGQLSLSGRGAEDPPKED